MKIHFLNHIFEEEVKLIFTVAKVATLNVVSNLLSPATTWVVQLEVPQEVVGVLKVGSNGDDLVNEILNTDDATTLAKLPLDDRVVSQGSSLSVDLAETSFVDEVAHVLKGRVAPGDVRLGNSEHVDGSLVQLDEHTVVDLAQTEKLKHLSRLRWHTVDTVGRRRV